MTIRCNLCGSILPQGARFCSQCGSRVEIPLGQEGRWSVSVGGASERGAEEVLWVGYMSWRALVPVFALALAAAGCWSFVLTAPSNGSNQGSHPWLSAMVWNGWLAIAMVTTAYWLYRRWDDTYTLSTRRIMYRHGILSRATHFTEIIDVDDVAVQQALWERVLGVGTIRITTSDDSHPWLNVAGVYPVHEIAELIDEARHRERVARGLHVEVI